LIAQRGPDWQRYNQEGQLAADCRKHDAECAVVQKQTHEMSLSITVHEVATIRLPIFAFPAWQVRVDGQVQPLEFDEASGLISVPLNVGKHLVRVTWIGLPAQAIGNMLSWAGLALLGLTLILKNLRVSRPFMLGTRALPRA
jgi:hypothetical protein